MRDSPQQMSGAMSNTYLDLSFTRICEGMPGFSSKAAAFHAEAACCCLARGRHAPPTQVRLDAAGTECRVQLTWTQPDERALATHDDLPEATEHGAVAIAIECVLATTDYVVVRRGRKPTGFDYWLGYPDDPAFQGKARLEVSGIQKAKAGQVARRLKVKEAQTKQSDSLCLPALAVVVDFGAPLVVYTRRMPR